MNASALGVIVNIMTLVGRLDPDGEPTTTLVEESPFTVGRRAFSSLRLTAHSVSGHHAEIYTHEGKYFVRDLGSTNGTFLNGVRITEDAEIKHGDWLQFASLTFQVKNEHRTTSAKTLDEKQIDQTLGLMQFERMMAIQDVIPLFQPIIDLSSRHTVAFEVLASSPYMGLRSAGELFKCAEDLGRAGELSQLIRIAAINNSRQGLPANHLFLNVHPDELEISDLQWIAELRNQTETHELTLEIHEDATTDPAIMAQLRSCLSDYKIGLAFDDFGAGRARIAQLTDLQPDYVKFDRRLISDIDTAPIERYRFVKNLVSAVNELGITSLAEGVETLGESHICTELGFQLGQGYFYGFPAPIRTYLCP